MIKTHTKPMKTFKIDRGTEGTYDECRVTVHTATGEPVCITTPLPSVIYAEATELFEGDLTDPKTWCNNRISHRQLMWRALRACGHLHMTFQYWSLEERARVLAGHAIIRQRFFKACTEEVSVQVSYCAETEIKTPRPCAVQLRCEDCGQDMTRAPDTRRYCPLCNPVCGRAITLDLNSAVATLALPEHITDEIWLHPEKDPGVKSFRTEYVAGAEKWYIATIAGVGSAYGPTPDVALATLRSIFEYTEKKKALRSLAKISLFGTQTGRFSCAAPNHASPPKSIMKRRLPFLRCQPETQTEGIALLGMIVDTVNRYAYLGTHTFRARLEEYGVPWPKTRYTQLEEVYTLMGSTRDVNAVLTQWWDDIVEDLPQDAADRLNRAYHIIRRDRGRITHTQVHAILDEASNLLPEKLHRSLRGGRHWVSLALLMCTGRDFLPDLLEV